MHRLIRWLVGLFRCEPSEISDESEGLARLLIPPLGEW